MNIGSSTSRRGAAAKPPKVKKVCVMFFYVDMGDDCQECFTRVLESYHVKTPDHKNRNWEYDNDLYRVENFELNGDDSTGVLVRLKQDTEQKTASPSRPGMRELQLPDGERLIDEMVFRYYDDTKTLAVERNKFIGSHNRLAAYLRNKAGKRGVYFHEWMRQDAAKRLKAMTVVSKMELGVRYPAQKTLFDDNDAVSMLHTLQSAFGGLQVELRVRKGRGKRMTPLHATSVKEKFEQLHTVLGVNLHKYRVHGDAPGIGENILVDMLKDVATETVEVTYTGKGLLLSQRIEALNTAYCQRRDDFHSPPV